jgi:hypothetical protein
VASSPRPSRSRASPLPEGAEECVSGPVCDEAPHPRYTPGEYLVRCTDARIYREPRFRAWKCRLTMAFTHERGEVCKFLHMGRGEAPKAGRSSEFMRLWLLANGGRPKRGCTLTPRVFKGRFFTVMVGDTVRRFDGRDHPEAAVYSVVKEILEIKPEGGSEEAKCAAPTQAFKHLSTQPLNQAGTQAAKQPTKVGIGQVPTQEQVSGVHAEFPPRR